MLEQLVTQYGYAALLVGTFFEGETVLVIAGFLAHRGYLDLPWVMGVALLGTFAGDQLFFYLGRHRGTAWIARRPVWQSKTARILALLQRHEIPVVLGFRFLYGLRTVTPFIIGASGFHPLRFFLLNGTGAAVWAVVVGALGYVFGHAVELVLAEVRHYEVQILVLIAVVGGIVWLVRRMADAARVRELRARARYLAERNDPPLGLDRNPGD